MSDYYKKVLIIEDDIGYRNPLTSFLSAHACTVFTADNGEQAMEKILFYGPDLVILDLMLPKVDGFEVLKRIRKYPQKQVSGIPIVVLSNLSGEEDMKKAEALKIDAYFVKSNTTNDDILKKTVDILYKGSPPPLKDVWDFTKPM